MFNKSQLISLRVPGELIPEILQYGQTRNLVKSNGKVNMAESIVALLKKALQVNDESPKVVEQVPMIAALQVQVETLTNELANTVKLADLQAFKDSILGESAA